MVVLNEDEIEAGVLPGRLAVDLGKETAFVAVFLRSDDLDGWNRRLLDQHHEPQRSNRRLGDRLPPVPHSLPEAVASRHPYTGFLGA